MMAVRLPPARPAWQTERLLVADLKKGRPEAGAAFARDPGAALYRLARAATDGDDSARDYYVQGLALALARSAFRAEPQELGPWLAGQLLLAADRDAAATAAGAVGSSVDEPGRRRGGRRQERRPGGGPDAGAGRTGREPDLEGAPFRDWSAAVSDAGARAALLSSLRQAAAALPHELYRAWLLVDAAGFSATGAAIALDLTEGATLMRLHRARLRLCAALQTVVPAPTDTASAGPPASTDATACAECRFELRAWSDRALTQEEDAALQTHLAACPGCEGLARCYRAVRELSAALTPEQPSPPDLEQLTSLARSQALGIQGAEDKEVADDGESPGQDGA